MDNYTPRLKEMYVNTIVPKLKNDLSKHWPWRGSK